MKRKSKNLLSLLLAFVMIFSTIAPGISVPVYAADDDSELMEEYLESYLNSLNFSVDPNNMQLFDLTAMQATAPISGDTLTPSGGSVGANGQYIITVGNVDDYVSNRFALTIERPMGGNASYPVSVDAYMISPGGSMAYNAQLYADASGFDTVESIVFEPGDTAATVYIDFNPRASSAGVGVETFFLQFSNPYRVEVQYPLVQFNFNRNGSTDNLNNGYTPGNKPNITIFTPIYGGVFEVGDLIPLGVEYESGFTYVNIMQDQKLTLQRRDGSFIALTPVEVGTTGNRATFLYPLSESDLGGDHQSLGVEIISLDGVEIYGTTDTWNYVTAEIPGYNFDLSNAFTVTPSYGMVTADKSSYQGNESVTITIPIENASALAYNSSIYPLDSSFQNWFKLSLDGGVTFLDRQYVTCSGGAISVEFPAPLNTTDSNVTYYAEVFEVTEINGTSVATAIPGAYNTFEVTTAEAAVTPVTSLTINGVPAGNRISLDGITTYDLTCTVAPSDATFKSYTFESSNPGVFSVTPEGRLVAHAQGSATLTVTSEEYAYRLSKNETPDAALKTSVQILVGNVAPSILASPAIVRYEETNYITVNLSNNFHLLGDMPYNYAYELYTAGHVGVESEKKASGTLPGKANAVVSIAFTGQDVLKTISTYTNGEYAPVYQLKVTATEPYTNMEVSAVADVVILPPRPSISTGRTLSTYVIYNGGSVAVPNVYINNLTPSEYDVSYTVTKNGQVFGSTVSWDESGSAPGGFTKYPGQVGGVDSFNGSIAFTPEAPGANAYDTYTLQITAQNGGQTAEQKAVSIIVVSNAEALINVTGKRASDVSAAAITNGTRFTDSITFDNVDTELSKGTSAGTLAAFDLLNKAYPAQTLTFNEPAVWGSAELYMGDTKVYEKAGGFGTATVTWPVNGSDVNVTAKWPAVGREMTWSYTQKGFYWNSYARYFYVIALPYISGDARDLTAYVTYKTNNGVQVHGGTVLLAQLDEAYKKQYGNVAVGIFYTYSPLSSDIVVTQNRTDGLTYAGQIANPVRVSYRSAVTSITGGSALAPSVEINKTGQLVQSPHVGLTIVGADGEIFEKNVDYGYNNVTFLIVDKDLNPVDTGSYPNSTGTIGLDNTIWVNYTPLLSNPEYRILVECSPRETRTKYIAQLFFIDYEQLQSAMGFNRRSNITIKLTLSNTRNNPTGVRKATSSAVLTDVNGSLELMRQGMGVITPYDNSTAVLEVIAAWPDNLWISPSELCYQAQYSSENGKPKMAEMIGAGASKLGMLKGRYAFLQYKLEGLSRENQINKTVLIYYKDSKNFLNTFTVLPGLANAVTGEAGLKSALVSQMTFPAPGNNKLSELNSTDDNVDENVKDAFDDFNIPLPSMGLPFKFDVQKSGDTYKIRGVMSYNVIPDMVEVPQWAEIATDFEEMFTSVTNQVLQKKVSDNLSFGRQNKGKMLEVFAGFRGYLVGTTVYNPSKGTMDVTIVEGAVVIEVSGSLGSTMRIKLVEVGFSVDGMISSTIGLRRPSDVNLALSTSLIKTDFFIENHMAVELTATVGVGVDFFIGNASAGVGGTAGASFDQLIIFRPYLDNRYIQRYETGFKSTTYAELFAYTKGEVLWMSWKNRHTIWSGSSTKHTPNNSTNPYLNGSVRTAVLTADMIPLGMNIPGVDVDDLSGSASARLYGNGGGSMAYKDIKDPADYNDDRIMVAGGGMLHNSVAYGFDLSASGGNKAVAAWETLTETISQDAINGFTPGQQLAGYAGKMEIMAASHDGTGWMATRLSDNTMLDMSPVTAANGNKGVVVWTRGQLDVADMDSTGDFDISTLAVRGDLVYSKFNGSSWSVPAVLTALDQNGDPNDPDPIVSYKAAMDDSGNIIVALVTKSGAISYACVNTSGAVTVAQGPSGVNPQIIWDGTAFVTAYYAGSADTGYSLYLSTVDVSGMQSAAKKIDEVPVSTDLTIRLVRDENKTGVGSLGLLWKEIGDLGEPIRAALLSGTVDSPSISAPITLATAPVELSVASYDPYLSGTVLKAAVVYADDNNAACVISKTAEFENAIDVQGVFYQVGQLVPDTPLPIEFTIVNTGYQPITDLIINIGGQGTALDLSQHPIKPNEKRIVTGNYTPADSSNPSYTLTATFAAGDKTASGTVTLNTVDAGVRILSVETDTDTTDILVDLFNGSMFSLDKASQKVVAGVYSDPYGEQPVGTIITLAGGDVETLNETGYSVLLPYTQPSEATMLYAVVKTYDVSNNELNDVNLLNNYVAFSAASADEPQDNTTTIKGRVESADYTVIQANVRTMAQAKAAVEAIIYTLNLTGVSFNVVDGVFTPATAGTSRNINGTNGSYTFTVELNDGATQQITKTLTLIITATPYKGGGSASRREGNRGSSDDYDDTSSDNSDTSGDNGDSSSDIDSRTSQTIIGGFDITTNSSELPVENADGTTTLPGGGTIKTPGGSVITVPEGTTISTDGNTITIPDGKTTDIALPSSTGATMTAPGKTTVTKDGIITVGGGTAIINLSGGKQIAVQGGTVITEGGKVTPPNGDGVTITHPVGWTFQIKPGTPLTLDQNAPLGYTVRFDNPFTDIAGGEWYYNDIAFVYTHGLFGGTDVDTLSPNVHMTRSMLVTVLYRLSGRPPVSGENAFNDVDNGLWYTDAVSWAKANGIVSGVGDNRFAPDAEITRQDLVTMLKQYIDFMGATLPEAQTNSDFIDDTDIANYAKDAVEAFFRAGIVKGKPSNLFDPKGTAIRAEVAAILHRLVQSAAK